jgi:hypothetical protein
VSAPEDLAPNEDAVAHSLQDRVYRNQRIQDVAAMGGWGDICDVIKEKLAAAQHRLAFGLCTTIEDYRSTSAEAQALAWVLTIPDLVQAKLNELRAAAFEDRAAQEDDDDG